MGNFLFAVNKYLFTFATVNGDFLRHRGVAQLASVLAWGARGRPFKSDHPDRRNRGLENSIPLLFYEMYHTYILYSNSVRKYYTGQTEDLGRRIQEHNRGKTAFMKSGIPWVILYSKEFDNRAEAVKLEGTIKKRGAARFLSDMNIEIG